MTKKKHVNFLLDHDMCRQIDRIASAYGTNKSNAARMLLIIGLADIDNDKRHIKPHKSSGSNYDKHMSFYVQSKTVAHIKALSERFGANKSVIIRQAIATGLNTLPQSVWFNDLVFVCACVHCGQRAELKTSVRGNSTKDSVFTCSSCKAVNVISVKITAQINLV